MKRLTLFFLLFTSIISYSQEKFESIGTTSKGLEYFIKVDKSDSYTNSISIWFKIQKAPIKSKTKKGKIISKSGGSQINYMTFYMNDSTFDDLEYVIYTSDGTIHDSGNHFDYKSKIFPDTVAEMILDYLKLNYNY